MGRNSVLLWWFRTRPCQNNTIQLKLRISKAYLEPCQTSKMNGFAKIPAGNYMFKVKYRNTRTRREICSKLTIKTPGRRSGVFIANFEHISHLVLVFLLLALNM